MLKFKKKKNQNGDLLKGWSKIGLFLNFAGLARRYL